MFERFKWTSASRRRNIATAEYEPVQPYVLLALAEQAGCESFVDVGANIGAYSLFASLIPTVSRIVAYEANPHAADQLRVNASLNQLAVDIREVAVSREAGQLQFGLVSRLAGNNGAVETSDAAFAEQVAVLAVSLDEEFPEPFPRPVCVKIDVEGHEVEVLAGAEFFFRSNRCVIQVEDYKGTVSKILHGLGYESLTTIGPDQYFSNIPGMDPVAAYELAARRMIDENHRLKAMTLKFGDFGVQVSGSSARVIRSAIRKIVGRRL